MFKGTPKRSKPKKNEIKNTYIAKEIEIRGDFNGKGAIQVEGVLHGDISVDSVVIGEYGTINGTIRATNVIVNGKLNGAIFCDTLEVMPNGNIHNEIKVNKILISGNINGSIESKEEIIIDQTGEVTATTMKSKNILVNGNFKGKLISSELLKIGSTGSVEGEITINNIKTYEGGKLLGSLHNYIEKEVNELFTEISES